MRYCVIILIWARALCIETFRPEVRQYLFEDDQVKVPFSRQQRALAYQRAKNVSDTSAFGTPEDLYQSGKEWFLQSTVAHPLKQTNFRIRVGNKKCQQPYDISVFNISAMSFGSLSAAAIESLNKGANMGGLPMIRVRARLVRIIGFMAVT